MGCASPPGQKSPCTSTARAEPPPGGARESPGKAHLPLGWAWNQGSSRGQGGRVSDLNLKPKGKGQARDTDAPILLARGGKPWASCVQGLNRAGAPGAGLTPLGNEVTSLPEYAPSGTGCWGDALPEMGGSGPSSPAPQSVPSLPPVPAPPAKWGDGGSAPVIRLGTHRPGRTMAPPGGLL